MEENEWRRLVENINLDVAGIVAAQQTLNEVHDVLRDREGRPLEEDFIHADAFGQEIGRPHVVDINGVQIQSRMLHRKGMSQADVKGADLLYEIAGRKFVLIQYKTPDTRNRVTLDRSQLEDLVGACPNPCPPHSVNLFPTCGAWYAVRGKGYSSYLPACKAHEIFDTASSRSRDHFNAGLSHETFQQVFARCWTGARIAPPEMAYLTWSSMEADRVLFTVLQRGSFGRW